MKSIVSALVVFFIATPVYADHHEEATPESYQRLGKLMVGRWKSDIKFIADWEGEKEGKGDVVHGFVEFAWKADKHLITAVETGGEHSAHWSIMHNPVSKKIRIIITGTRGAAIEADMWQRSANVFAWKVTAGGEPDGKALTGAGEYVFSDDGKKLTMQGNLKLGGEPLDPYNDVYYRLSPLNN